MTPEIRRAALRATAKIAFVAAVGCGGDQAKAPVSNTSSEGSGPAAPRSCVAYLKSLKAVERGSLADGDPLKDRQDVYGAFANIEDRTNPRTIECCKEQLKAGIPETARWECCSVVGADPGNATACSPWGPPCPPEMPVA